MRSSCALADVGSCEIFQQTTALHDADATGGLLRAEEIVRRHENGDACAREFQQQRAELVRRLRIEAGQRLIEQQCARVLGERDGQPDLLPHSFRVALDP